MEFLEWRSKGSTMKDLIRKEEIRTELNIFSEEETSEGPKKMARLKTGLEA